MVSDEFVRCRAACSVDLTGCYFNRNDLINKNYIEDDT